MKINPKQESEISNNRFEPLPPGEYPFTVMESGIKVSQSAKNPGKEFVKVKINVHGTNGDRHVYDQFADWFSEWKLKHFCETTGMALVYSRGDIAPEGSAWRDRTGFVKIKIKPAQEGYDASNEVVDYIPKHGQKVEDLKPVDESAPEKSDDVPF